MVVLLITFISLFLLFHGIFTLIWMLYAWEDPHYAKEHSAPKKIEPPYHSFSLLLPARHEKGVIEQTIRSLTSLNYPKNLTEILVLIRSDDHETLLSAQQAYLKH